MCVCACVHACVHVRACVSVSMCQCAFLLEYVVRAFRVWVHVCVCVCVFLSV